jgi:hypothetical protein
MSTRREFAGHLVAGAAGLALAGTSLTLEGCNALDELESWVPIGLAAFDGLASIIDGPFTAIATTVDALWAAVENAISLYQHSTDPVNTKLDKLIAVLDALAGGLSQALAALPVSIPAGVLAAARAGLALLIATLKSIRNKLEPSPAPTAYAAAAGATPASSASDFKSKWNAIMKANGVNAQVR